MPRALAVRRTPRRGRVVVAGRRLSTRALAAALERIGAHVRRVTPDDLDVAVGEPNVVAVVGVARPGEPILRALRRVAAANRDIPVFVAFTRTPRPKATRALYADGVEGVFTWPRERRDLLYAIMRSRQVLAATGRPSASNPELARRVRKRLAADPAELGNGIRVRALDDVVVLRGTVDALWKIAAVEKTALATPGVARVIANHLEVADSEMPDRWIAESVRRMLRGAAGVDASTIAVDVEDGVVTLAGTVASRAEMSTLVHLVEHARGVKSIENLTTVSDAAKRTDRAAARAVRAAVSTACPTAKVDVSVFSGVAVVAGRAGRPRDTSAIEEAALRQSGVRRVVNKVWANATN